MAPEVAYACLGFDVVQNVGRRAVDGLLIACGPVVGNALWSFSVRPVLQYIALALVFHKGDSIATAGLRHLDRDVVDLPRAVIMLKIRIERFKLRVARVQGFGGSINAQDHRLCGEAAPHQRHAVDLREMTGGFVARTGQVAPYDAVWPHHTQTVHPFGRDIHAACGGCRGAKEQMLRLDEFDECLVKRVVAGQ